MKKRASNIKKYIIILFIIFIIAIIFLFGAKLYLIVNLLLGNDVLIKLSVDNENLFLTNNQSQDIKITTNLLANPFCTVNCDFVFKDLSNNQILDADNFSVNTIEPISKSYTLTSPEKGTGQKIYRFEIQCSSKKTYLCDTSGESQARTLIITLNYDLTEEQKIIRNQTKYEIEQAYKELVLFNSNIQELNKTILELNKTIPISINSEPLQYQLLLTNITLNSAIKSWRESDFSSISLSLSNLKTGLSELENMINQTKDSIINNLTSYNSIIDLLNQAQYNLIKLKDVNLTNETLQESKELIIQFNNISFSLIGKQAQISNLRLKSEELYNKALQSQSLIEANYTLTETPNQINLAKLNLTVPIISINDNLDLQESISYCCLFNKCNVCCGDSCKYDKTKYPVIFIHGHDFNERISAEYNLHMFSNFQKQFEEQGYIDMGSLLLSSNENTLTGIWGRINYPITVRASYYFDTLINSKGNTILQTKQDNIDTYAIRLNDIIKEVKFRTNKNKVILVSHSMGGLVIRRYLQIFNENDIEKAVLITSPNKGISGKSLSYCSIFGSKSECNDMDKDSLFMNKLANGKKPNIPIYNLIGTGCIMDDETGDGIIKNSSAYLEYADNYYINGTCDELKFIYLHTDITRIYKYPEVYSLVTEIITNSSA